MHVKVFGSLKVTSLDTVRNRKYDIELYVYKKERKYDGLMFGTECHDTNITISSGVFP